MKVHFIRSRNAETRVETAICGVKRDYKNGPISKITISWDLVTCKRRLKRRGK